jgi:lipopolysaccharide/colanic/teichoic acid biosynthesis glycosyltransferase
MLGIAWFAGRHRGTKANQHYGLFAEPHFKWLVVLLVLIWMATYVSGVTESGLTFGSRLVRASAAAGIPVVIVVLAEQVLRVHSVADFLLGMCILILVPLMTIATSLADRTLVRQGQQERVLALVGGEEADRLLRDHSKSPERQSQLVGLIAPEKLLPTEEQPAPLEDMVLANKATLIVLSREAQGLEPIVAQAVRLHSRGVRIRTLSLFYDEWLGKLPISELERIALLFDINEIHRPVYARVKRFLDVVLALAGCLLLVVLLPIVWLLDLLGNPGPLFYRQARVGKNGEEFTILKFRTMLPADGAPTHWTADDDPRVRKVGRALRKLHIDELPQVWNVLRKEMSIVGPRPEQPHYVLQLQETIPFYDVRHLVRPGITGWAQVKYDYGASELDALEKLQYEFYYLRHQDLGLDLRTMGRTVRSMLQGEGR